jgi:hypothetical protein
MTIPSDRISPLVAEPHSLIAILIILPSKKNIFKYYNLFPDSSILRILSSRLLLKLAE